MNPYEALIAQERDKLALLEEKVKACRQRIAALQSLAESDDIDAAINNVVAERRTDHQAPQPEPQPEPQPGPQPELAVPAHAEVPKIIGLRKDSVAPYVLTYLSGGVRTLDEIISELERCGHPRGRDPMRTALMNWRKKQGWVTNPRPGRYGLSDLGKKVVGVE